MTAAEVETRRLMDEAARDMHMVRQSPWVRNAQRGALPYKVYADMRTDARTDVVRESTSDMLWRTMGMLPDREVR